MKLNHDCVRDLLIFLENNLTYQNIYWISDIELSDYSHDDLLYTAEKLYEAGYIDCNIIKTLSSNQPQILIKEITWNGHELLDNIRDNSVWTKIKKKISGFASVSLPIINSVGASIITDLISK